jgi:hypothetical protein
MLSKLSFVTPGTNPAITADVMMGGLKLDGHAVTGTTMMMPSEAHLERNRAFASALGVEPVTARHNKNNFNSGWARPVTPTTNSMNHDDFGKELQMVQYPESLLTEARERMGDLLKLERRWKAFLVDDATASIPLRSMERPLRKFVHEYSDFWNLHTESFDPEPKRYIHCSKMRDTSMPHPLLSQAVQIQSRSTSIIVDLSQLPRGPTVTVSMPPPGNIFGDSDRPKLELAPRTLPLELPPPPDEENSDAAIQKMRDAQRRQEARRLQQEENKRQVLANAFASDDESASSSVDESDWDVEEDEAAYNYEDEEEAT